MAPRVYTTVYTRVGYASGYMPSSAIPRLSLSGDARPLLRGRRGGRPHAEQAQAAEGTPRQTSSRGHERTREDPRGPEMTPRRHLDRPPTGSANLGYISANISATSRRHLGDISTGCLPARAQAQDGPRLGGSHREIAERQPRDSREVAEIAGLRGAQLLPAATRETRLPSSADEPPPRRAAGTAEGGRGRR